MNFSDFALATDIIVIDTNPEMADATNPRGHIHGEATYIVATGPMGHRRRHRVQSVRNLRRTVEYTEYTVERLQALTDKLNEEDPILNAAHWFPMEPAYGSPAWQEQEPAMARREQADALFNEAIGL